MRLIDADNLVFNGRQYNNSQMKAILDFVDAQPTAYDPDKVVEQLYGLKKYGNKYDSYWDSSLYHMTEIENKTMVAME